MSPCGRAKQLVVFRRRQCAPLLQLIILEPVSSLRTQIRDVPAAKESLLETDSMDVGLEKRGPWAVAKRAVVAEIRV